MHEILIYALILFITKLVSELFTRIKLPTVIGIILAGILCGPVFHLIHVTPILDFLAEMGILFLMFIAGLETNIVQLKAQGKASILAAVMGVFVPLASALIFLLAGYSFRTTYLIGLTLTATSVSITVMTLIEIQRLNTRSGVTVLGAAVIDDIIAIMLLTFSMIFLTHTGNLMMTIIKLGIFAIGGTLLYMFLTYPSLKMVSRFRSPDSVTGIAVILMLMISFFSQSMGIAGITGAYITGLAISKTQFRRAVIEKVSTVTNILFVSMFFFVVGLKTSLSLAGMSIVFLISYILISIIGKILGSGFACRLAGMDMRESLRVGIGMIPRGEVALVIATMGFSAGLFSQGLFNATVIMILITSFITPIMLKAAYRIK